MAQAAEAILREVLFEDRLKAPHRAERSLAAGRRLDVANDGTRLEISTPEGEVELRVEITATGPVLHFTGASLSLASVGDVDLECENLSLRSRGLTRLESGNYEQRVAGGYQVAVRDDARLAAQAIDIEAELGDLALRANDDVALDGLRVLMNVPSDEEIEAARRRLRTFEQHLECPTETGGDSGRLPRSLPRKLSGWSTR